MEKDKMEAIIIAQAVNYAAPAFSGDRNSFNRKKNNWDNFLRNLTWKSISDRKDQVEKAKEGFLRVFAMANSQSKEKGDKN